jgi:hypothetical protein
LCHPTLTEPALHQGFPLFGDIGVQTRKSENFFSSEWQNWLHSGRGININLD